MTRIEIYGRDGCSYCDSAKMLCELRGYPFVYRNTTGDSQALAEMMARNPAAKTFPQIFVGDTLIGGFAELSGTPKAHLQQLIGE